MGSQKGKKIEEMIKEKNMLRNEVSRIENTLFKLESDYLDVTQGCSLVRNLDFYIHVKPEKKRILSEEEERVFSVNFPTQRII